MTNLVFVYGTLLSRFERPGGARLSQNLRPLGRGSIEAMLFDLGTYPAAIHATGSRVWGEVNQMLDEKFVLSVLDEFENCRVGEPGTSLYVRQEVPSDLDDGTSVLAWAYFYNASLGQAERIASGNYLQYLDEKRLVGGSSP